MKFSARSVNSALAEFSNHCSLHGIKYLGDEKIKWYEKVFWISVLIVSFYTSFRLLLFAWLDWDTSPFVIHSESRPHSVSTLPFPAVTVCTNQNINRAVLVSNLFNKDKNVRINTIKTLRIIMDTKFSTNIEESLLMDKEIDSFTEVTNVFKNLSTEVLNTDNTIQLTKETLLETLKQIMFLDKGLVSPFQNMACSFGYKCFNRTSRNDSSCHCLYSNYLITNKGMCFTVNMISPLDLLKNTTEYLHLSHDVDSLSSMRFWNVDRGYDSAPNGPPFPLPVDVTSNLISIGKLSENWSNLGKGAFSTFSVAIHHPADFPNNLLRWYHLEIGRRIVLTINPSVSYTVEALESVPAKKRNCYYSHEKKLEFFTFYTRMNCITECVSKLFHKKCNCTPFYMLHSQNSTFCNPLKKCVKQFSESINHGLNFLKQCHCLPLCSEVEYTVEMKDSAVSFPDSYTVGCEFQITEFFPLMRFPQTTFLNFVVTCITYLDTFLGVSLITFIEVIYFFVLVIVRGTLSSKNHFKKQKHNFNEFSPMPVSIDLLSKHGYKLKEDQRRRATIC